MVMSGGGQAALAASQGEVKVAVWNVGANTERAFQSKQAKPGFQKNMVSRVEQMQAAGVSIILVQELHEAIEVPLPSGWARCVQKQLQVFHKINWAVEGQQHRAVFPDSQSKKESWRYFQQSICMGQ